jgi:hypothetical protein
LAEKREPNQLIKVSIGGSNDSGLTEESRFPILQA